MHIKKSEIIKETKTRQGKKTEPQEKIIEKINDKPADLSATSKKQIKRINNLIDEAWADTRKQPNFVKTINRNKKISLTTIYTNEKRLALQIEFPDEYQKITIDERGTNFTYEKVVKTEYGSATTKSYNSKVSKPDKDIVQLVNVLLEENLPKFTANDNTVEELKKNKKK